MSHANASRRLEIVDRLDDEGRLDLADPLRECGRPVSLTCTACGAEREGRTHCDRKYCPECARRIAAERTSRFRNAVAEFRWPLFVTLTVPNSPDPACVQRLRADFGRLRRRVLWSRQVAGGVAGIEVTNTGDGWHPHLHSVIDCRWLAVKTPEPRWNRGVAGIEEACTAAKHEFSALWASIVGSAHAVTWIKRTKGADVVDEVLKYSLKPDGLTEIAEPLGPLIDALCASRLVTTFGSLYGRAAELTSRADDAETGCPGCGEAGHTMPTEIAWRLCRAS
jgi:hypothetical protein